MSIFLEKITNLKEITSETQYDICLLENNEKQINQIFDFLSNDKNLMLVNGFKGSGKTQIVKFATDNTLTQETLFLQYNCLETTTLDDMLLKFFQLFKTYTMMEKISQPKVRVENFSQKINAYFNTITNPILIVLDCFDLIVKENKSEIINFIKHLLTFSNIKIILIAKNFINDNLEELNFDKVTTLAFNQKIFEKYLRENGIKQIGVLSNELYKLTKGYYNYIKYATIIMKLKQLNLVNFLDLYSKSYMNYPEFIIREMLNLIDPVSIHLFRLLTVMRIPIHKNLLKSLQLYNEERIQFFVNNSLLEENDDCYYLKDVFREFLENQIPVNVMIKLHTSCIDLYNTQLPLKPAERDLMLSRQTMRNEIEYHTLFIPRKPLLLNSQEKKSTQTVETVSEQAKTAEDKIEGNSIIEHQTENQETTEEKINKISFIIDDELVLENIADTIKDFVTESTKSSQFELESSNMSLNQLMNTAKKEEQAYNYKRVIMLYQNALTRIKDDDFYTYLPTIYTKLAKAYQNLSDWYEALKYYNQAEDFYINISDFNKAYEIKLEIANVYYNMYKHENTKYILNELEKVKNLPSNIQIKTCLMLAKLSDDVHSEYQHCKKALLNVEPGSDKVLLTELYYRYGAVCDELDDIKTAVEYYKKCISLDNNPKTNSYLSNSYANLAQLCDEAGNSQTAIKYYTESIKFDTILKNYNGLYNSAVHLAEIYSSKDEEKSLAYLQKALDYAKILKEDYLITSAGFELGNYHFLHKNIDLAYKYFIEIFNLSKTIFSKDINEKVGSQINRIKKSISEEEYLKLQEKYGK